MVSPRRALPNKCIERKAGKRCLPVRFGVQPTPAAHARFRLLKENVRRGAENRDRLVF